MEDPENDFYQSKETSKAVFAYVVCRRSFPRGIASCDGEIENRCTAFGRCHNGKIRWCGRQCQRSEARVASNHSRQGQSESEICKVASRGLQLRPRRSDRFFRLLQELPGEVRSQPNVRSLL